HTRHPSTTGGGAGTRRIKKGIPISCVPEGEAAAGGAKDAKCNTHVREFRTEGGVCHGDSGSGAFEKSSLDGNAPKVLGILSRFVANGDECAEGVYTRLDTFRNF